MNRLFAVLMILNICSALAKNAPDIYMDSKIELSSADLLMQKMIRLMENYGMSNPLIGKYDTIEVADIQSSLQAMTATNNEMLKDVEEDFIKVLRGEKEKKIIHPPWSSFGQKIPESLMQARAESELDALVLLDSGKLTDYLPEDLYQALMSGGKLYRVPVNEARFNYRIHNLRYDFSNLGIQFLDSRAISDGLEMTFRFHIKSFNIQADFMSFLLTIPRPENKEKLYPLIASFLTGTEIRGDDIQNFYIDTRFSLKLVENKIKLQVEEYDQTAIKNYLHDHSQLTSEIADEACPSGVFPSSESQKLKLNIEDIYVRKRDFEVGGEKASLDSDKARCFIRSRYNQIRPLIFEVISKTLEKGIFTSLVEFMNTLEWDRSYWVNSTDPDEFTAGIKSFFLIQDIFGEAGNSSLEAYIPSDFCNTENFVSLTETEHECSAKLNIPRPKRTSEEFLKSKSLITQLLAEDKGHFVLSLGEDLINRLLFWMAESRFFNQSLEDINQKAKTVELSLGPKSVQVRFDRENSEVFTVYLDMLVKLKKKSHIFLLGTDQFRIPMVFEASAGFIPSGDFDEVTGESSPSFQMRFHSLDLTKKRLVQGAPEVGLPGIGSGDDSVAKIFHNYIKNTLIKSIKSEIPLLLDKSDEEEVKARYRKYQKHESEIAQLVQEMGELNARLQELADNSEQAKKIEKLLKLKEEAWTKLEKDKVALAPTFLDFTPTLGLKGMGLENMGLTSDGHGRIMVGLKIPPKKVVPYSAQQTPNTAALIWEGR